MIKFMCIGILFIFGLDVYVLSGIVFDKELY